MKKSLLLLVFFILVFSLFSCNEEPEIQKYTVTFDSNGGEDVESQEVAEGKFVLEPEDPEKEYCEFLGWYYKNKKYKFDTPVDSDITLKAKWKAIEYEIRFDTDGGSRVPPVKVDGGETVDAPDEPTKEKYTFLGWFLDGEEYDFSQPVGEDITLTAKWEEIVLEDDEIFSKMQSVLLLGQSNMVGVGD
ncbi:MAG: InlB B-repeat-containing protein, partial [Clostridia bacterium]|nr:InlB B-repeat-containing protein [Clostridia bacterium]